MTAPAILFPDPQRAVRDVLRDLLPAYGLDATVTTSGPTGATGVPLSRPHIRVRAGDIVRTSRVSADSVVRLTVWDTDEAAAMALAREAEAILLAEVTSPSLRGFGPLSGPVPGTDEPTGAPIAYLSISARLRPLTLSRKD